PPLHDTHCQLDHPSSSPLSTLSLHDALPIFSFLKGNILRHKILPRYYILSIFIGLTIIIGPAVHVWYLPRPVSMKVFYRSSPFQDRKSTRLNSSHVKISYAVFCLKKKRHAYT